MYTVIKGTGSSSGKCCGCGGRPYPCDGPPTSALQCRTAEATISKCGFPEFSSSTPPKVYLYLAQSGSITKQVDCTTCLTKTVYDWSGSITLNKSPCYTWSSNSTQLVTTHYSYDCVNPTFYTVNTPQRIWDGVAETPDSYTATTHTITGIGCLPPPTNEDWSGSATETLSVEWTTAELETDVTNAIPSYGPFLSEVYCSNGYYDKSTDEITITKRKMQYKWVLPSLTGYSCYRITWDEVFTPKGGGSTTITSKNYTWNGYDAETPIYEIDVPALEGTTAVDNIIYSCTCS